MGQNKLIVTGGYYIISLIFVAYLVSMLMQFLSNLGYPFKVPIKLHPGAVVESFMDLPAAMGVVVILAGLCTLLAYTATYGVPGRDERNFTYSRRGTYGTAHWMTNEQINQSFKQKSPNDTEGIILGKKDGKIVCLPKNTMSNKNVAVYGASGSRKSRSFVRPMIFERMKAGESMVITDPKGELYRDTAETLRKNGYNVKVFNLKAFESSDSWNCLGEINGEQLDINAAIFTDIIIKNTSNQFNTNDFWDNAEHNLLKALVLYVGASPSYTGHRTIGEVYRLVTQMGIDSLDSVFKQLEPTDPAVMPYNIFYQAGNLRPNIIVGLGTRIQVFQNNQVVNATSLPDIDLLKPGQEKSAYYVITSDQSGTFDFLASLFFSFLFIKLVDYADGLMDSRLPVPVYFIMDEFPNIGAIPDFEKKISTVRSRDISISIIFQNLAQMQNRYPHGVWEGILGNCDTHLFLGCTDQTTAKYISTRTGEVTVVVDTIRQDKKTFAPVQYIPEYAKSTGDGKRMLMTLDEVMTMDPNEMLVLSNAKPALKLQKYDYTEHPIAKDLVLSVHTDHVPAWRQRKIRQEEELAALNEAETIPTSEDVDEMKEDFMEFSRNSLKASMAEQATPKYDSENENEEESHESIEDVAPAKKPPPEAFLNINTPSSKNTHENKTNKPAQEVEKEEEAIQEPEASKTTEQKVVDQPKLPEQKVVDQPKLPEQKVVDQPKLPEQRVIDQPKPPEQRVMAQPKPPEQKVTNQPKPPEQKLKLDPSKSMQDYFNDIVGNHDTPVNTPEEERPTLESEIVSAAPVQSSSQPQEDYNKQILEDFMDDDEIY